MNLDWRRLKAVVIESDDWGLCAWSPDEQAHRVLADTPVFRSPVGHIYGRSTLESAADVRALAHGLLQLRGGDGMLPVWQANTVMAAPDYARLSPPGFEAGTLPVVVLPALPSRWQRPGLWTEVEAARDHGVWWPELHGLHHLPAHAWLAALRRGEDDARRALEQQSPVCRAVDASGEYDPSEPVETRTRDLECAVAAFTRLFGRAPESLCPPDYRWDARLEADATRLGVRTLQGRSERHGRWLARPRRWLDRMRWSGAGARFAMPPRIAFEPRGARDGPAAEVAHRAARAAWRRGQPAVVSTHRLNYAHLDPAWSEAGRAALGTLLARLCGDGAVFLTDTEVRQLHARAWSLRAIGARGALLRYHGVPRAPVRFPAPDGVVGASLRDGRDGADVAVAAGEVTCRLHVGTARIEWRRA